MPNLEDIIAEARKSLTCPVCGKKFEAHEIKLRGFLDNAYIIQTMCDNGHPPLMTVFVASAGQNGTPTFVLQSNKTHKTKISTDEVIDGHLQVEQFDGDFMKLWSK
jgi:C4-type Zn-finger protein